ncbi:hypothetical protein Tco_0173329 [Tanacetum coccineum]
MWKVLWILLSSSGSSSLYATGPIRSRILNGPMYRGLSFPHFSNRKIPLRGSGYQQKDRKPSQNDKTEHGMEKTVQNQGQSPKMPKSESKQKNQQSNRSRN